MTNWHLGSDDLPRDREILVLDWKLDQRIVEPHVTTSYKGRPDVEDWRVCDSEHDGDWYNTCLDADEILAWAEIPEPPLPEVAQALAVIREARARRYTSEGNLLPEGTQNMLTSREFSDIQDEQREMVKKAIAERIATKG